MIHLPVPEKFPSRLEEAPREEMSSYASSEELSVHNESLDKKRANDQPPVPMQVEENLFKNYCCFSIFCIFLVFNGL